MQPYFASKALSEKKAFELAKEYNLNLVTLLPTLVTGPFLLDKIPNSVADAISLVTGKHMHAQAHTHTLSLKIIIIIILEKDLVK